MKQITLTLDRLVFYCPVTGKQVLNDEDFDPSPAMLFCFFDEDAEFQYVLDFIQEKYNSCLKKSDKKEDKLIAFDELTNTILVGPGYLQFTFIDGRSGNSLHIAFDMNYQEGHNEI